MDTTRTTMHPRVAERATRPTLRQRRRRPRRQWALTTAAVAAAVAPIVAAPGHGAAHHDRPPRPGRDASVIWEWNATAMDVLTSSNRPLLTQPFVTTAMHVAMYDAVVAIDRYSEPFLSRLRAPRGASPEAAAAAAAHGVLVEFVPEHAAAFDAALAASLADIPDGWAETTGVAVGEAAAAATLAERLNDGSQSGPVPPALPPGPGVWAPTPPNTSGLTPWLATAKPYTMDSPDQFRPAAPPGLGSRTYREAVDELRRVGGATSPERTEEQTEIARFWADQPIAQNQRTLRNHAATLGWGIAPTARLFAAVMTSEADAFIACWDAKYTFQFWRPWQSVPTVDPTWAPLLGTPNHPEFPSAHGCLTGALAYSLAKVMRTQRIDLDVDAANIGVTRHYTHRDQLLTEVGEARIWGGLHYRFSTEAGLDIAKQVVRQNLRENFRLRA